MTTCVHERYERGRHDRRPDDELAMTERIAVSPLVVSNGRRVLPPVRVVRLSRHDAAAWALMPALMRRVADWSARFGQGDVSSFIAKVEAAFVLDVPTVAVWVLLIGDRIAGHLIASDDQFSGRRVALVNHLVVDSGRLPYPLRKGATLELEQWARSIGASELMMVTSHLEPKAWRRYGFQPYRLIGRKEAR